MPVRVFWQALYFKKRGNVYAESRNATIHRRTN